MTQQLGKYQLIRKLAAGGMAEVFLAKAEGPMGFEKTLVVKRILPDFARDPAFIEMFLGEAKLAAQLNHPNIVQIFDFGEADGAYFLAMEYIDGPNLRTLLKCANSSGITLPPALCARLVAAACEGLASAHGFQDPTTGEPLNLIHRDISPDNILVSRQGALKVVDFGIAKATGQRHKTQSGIIKGKLSYMSPEQVRAKPLDRRADVYALGVVFYELLTGNMPFDAPTDASLMQAILFEEPVPATQWQPELPEPVQRILTRVLAKDREQRYPDCLALAADLEEFILSTGKPVTTQQIAQFIAQVAPNSAAPMATPQGGTPSGEARSGPRPAEVPIRGDSVALAEPPPEELPAKTMVLPAEPAPSTERQATPPPSNKRWVPAVAGAVLFAAGGGIAFWKSSRPAHVAPPQVVEALPAPMPLPPEPPKPPEGEQTTHPSAQPPAVAKSEPTGTPPSSPAQAPETPRQAVAPEKLRGKQHQPPSGTKRAPPQPVGKGTVGFRALPYARVILNGRELGQTPLDPIEQPAGHYTVQFINDDLKKQVTQTFELKPGETRTIKVNLEK